MPAAALAAIAAAAAMDRGAFEPYVGPADPLVAAVFVALVGVGALTFLEQRGWSTVQEPPVTRRGVRVAVALALAFAAVVVPADLVLGYPADINVAVPTALLFYPAIGFMAEVVFHAVPLAVLEAMLGRARPDRATLVRVLVGTVALVEPAFQVLLAEGASVSLQVFTGLHLYAFNLAQLELFRRHDFVSMFSLRLAYYVLWHIVWGSIRLDLVIG